VTEHGPLWQRLQKGLKEKGGSRRGRGGRKSRRGGGAKSDLPLGGEGKKGGLWGEGGFKKPRKEPRGKNSEEGES